MRRNFCSIEYQLRLGRMSLSLVVCGPSGSGKSTLLKRLLKEFQDCFQFSVSHTTRKKREEEENGKEYHFVSEEHFRGMIAKKEFLEWTRFADHFYGTSFAALNSVKNSGKIPVLDLELKGVLKVKEMKEFSAKYLLIRTKDLKTLERNLRKRGTEEEESVLKRLQRAKEDLEEVDTRAVKGDVVFDKTIVNEDIEKAFEEMKQFLNEDISKVRENLKKS